MSFNGDNLYKNPTGSGVRIAHDKADIHEGEEIILTMKDTQILEDGRNLNLDYIDTLEDVQLAQDYKRQYFRKVNEE